MRRMRFVGQYTNGRNTITFLDCTFTGHEAREVNEEVFEHLRGNQEFEAIHPLDHDGDGRKGGWLRGLLRRKGA